jgi:hypothetical protein
VRKPDRAAECSALIVACSTARSVRRGGTVPPVCVYGGVCSVPSASQTPAATHAPVVALSPLPAPPTAPTLTWADVEALLR